MSWQEFNNQYLSQEIFRLQQQVEKVLDPSFKITPLLSLVPDIQSSDFPPPALETQGKRKKTCPQKCYGFIATISTSSM